VLFVQLCLSLLGGRHIPATFRDRFLQCLAVGADRLDACVGVGDTLCQAFQDALIVVYLCRKCGDALTKVAQFAAAGNQSSGVALRSDT